jgi:hypothetical protein
MTQKPREHSVLRLSSKAGIDQCPNLKTARQRERKNYFSLKLLLFYSGFQWVGWGTLGRKMCFTHSSYSHVTIIKKYPHTHSANIWAPCGPVKSTHEINLHLLLQSSVKQNNLLGIRESVVRLCFDWVGAMTTPLLPCSGWVHLASGS